MSAPEEEVKKKKKKSKKKLSPPKITFGNTLSPNPPTEESPPVGVKSNAMEFSGTSFRSANNVEADKMVPVREDELMDMVKDLNQTRAKQMELQTYSQRLALMNALQNVARFLPCCCIAQIHFLECLQ